MGLSVTCEGELAFPSKYVCAADLKEQDRTVTIANVQIDELTMVGGKKQKKPVIYFKESPKMMVVNKTNAKTIANLHGTEMKQWIGKRITLYPTTAMFGPQKVPAVRVREKVPPAPQQPRQQPRENLPPTPEEMAGYAAQEAAQHAENDAEYYEHQQAHQ